jgi:hypothetical protein
MTTMLEKMVEAMKGATTLQGVSSINLTPGAVPLDRANPNRVQIGPLLDYTALARAALQAIREPDGAMREAGRDYDGVGNEPAVRGFTAMIDAILDERDPAA